MSLPNNPNQLDVVKAVQDLEKSLANIENIIFYNNTITKPTVINLSSYAYIGNTFAVNQIVGIIFSQNNNDIDKSFIHQNIQKVKVTAVDGNNVTVENINGDTSSKFLFNDYVEFYHSTSSDNTAYKQGMSRKGISDALTLLDNKIPTKTSQLTNDSGFVTSSAIPTKVSELINDSGFTGSDIEAFYQTDYGNTLRFKNGIQIFWTSAGSNATGLRSLAFDYPFKTVPIVAANYRFATGKDSDTIGIADACFKDTTTTAFKWTQRYSNRGLMNIIAIGTWK